MPARTLCFWIALLGDPARASISRCFSAPGLDGSSALDDARASGNGADRAELPEPGRLRGTILQIDKLRANRLANAVEIGMAGDARHARRRGWLAGAGRRSGESGGDRGKGDGGRQRRRRRDRASEPGKTSARFLLDQQEYGDGRGQRPTSSAPRPAGDVRRSTKSPMRCVIGDFQSSCILGNLKI